jgi:hypothetical protein
MWFSELERTAEQASNYCQKADTRITDDPDCGPHIFGLLSNPHKGKRNDLRDVVTLIKQGKRARDFIDSHPHVVARYPRFIDTVMRHHPRPRPNAVRVVLLYGPPGFSKTRFIIDKHKDHDMQFAPVSNGNLWFDGYDGHSIFVLDDFAGASSHIPLTQLLRILDRYAGIMVPVKSSFVNFTPDKIYITTNAHPFDWYKYGKRLDQYAALCRRITKVKAITEDSPNSLTTLNTPELLQSFWTRNFDVDTPYMEFNDDLSLKVQDQQKWLPMWKTIQAPQESLAESNYVVQRPPSPTTMRQRAHDRQQQAQLEALQNNQ